MRALKFFMWWNGVLGLAGVYMAGIRLFENNVPLFILDMIFIGILLHSFLKSRQELHEHRERQWQQDLASQEWEQL